MSDLKSNRSAQHRTRKSFAKIPEVMALPDLMAIQIESFERFKTDGIREAFRDIPPIENSQKKISLEFLDHEISEPKHSVMECKARDLSYECSLFVQARLVDKSTGEIKLQQDIFMGDIPVMTDQGTFIIKGTECVVVSQLDRKSVV